MTKTSMALLGITAIGAGGVLIYTLSEARAKGRERSGDRSSMLPLLDSACDASGRGDRFGFMQSIQAAATLLDSTAEPRLGNENPTLLGQYQLAISAPETLPLCESFGGPTMLSIAADLASQGYDYEAGQVLRIVVAEASDAEPGPFNPIQPGL